MTNNNGNSTADELAEYLRHEASRNNNGGSSSSSTAADDESIRRHALEQLVESTLGANMTSAAQRMVLAEGFSQESGMRAAANELLESSSFRQLQDAVEQCSLQLPPGPTSFADVDGTANKRAKTPESSASPVTAPAPAAPTSFSLFDMLDAQKGGGFTLPPRIMAYKVIETYQSEKQQNNTVSDDTGESTTLELLEKADDMEDLSPDPESWEEVQKILYEGLRTNSDDDVEEASRYLKVHKTLFEKCLGNNEFRTQLWSLANNLVGALLTFTLQFKENDSSVMASQQSMDLVWDIAQSLRIALSQLVVDYVRSKVGHELEIERMVLGLCFILSNDHSACILGMMEPMAGYFEVWSRFVMDPKQFMAIVYASGLGGVVLRRCGCYGRNDSSESISKIVGTSLGEIEQCNFLQSMSILRTMLCRCGGSKEVISMIYKQFTSGSIEKDSTTTNLSSFLLPHGVASLDDIQTLLKTAKETWKQHYAKNQLHHNLEGDAVKSILKPFQIISMVKETDPDKVDSVLEALCTQTIQLLQHD